MMLSRALGLLALALPGMVVAQTAQEECGAVIYQLYGQFSYEGPIEGGNDEDSIFWATVCTNRIAVLSEFAAAKLYCSPEDYQPSVDLIANWCQRYGDVTMLPISDFAANLTDEAIRKLPVLGPSDPRLRKNISAPFLIAKPVYDLGYKTATIWDWEMETHKNYG